MAVQKKKQESFLDYLKWAVPGYIAFIYVCLHIMAAEAETFDIQIEAGIQQAFLRPLAIFPIDWSLVGILLYFGLLALGVLYVHFLRHKQMRPGVESGSAAWNTDLKSYNKIYTAPKGKPTTDRGGDDNKNIILTNDVFLSMNGRDTMRNLNVLVAGGSGSGKSRFVVKPNLLQANCSYVVTDPKGELLASTGDFLKKRGYKIKVFNLSQMEHSCSYNPFNYIRDENGVLTMITALIQNTTPKGASKGDPFWEKAETALLQAICFYLYYECREEDRNFTNVMKLLRCLEVREGQEDYDSTLDIMFKTLKEKNPEHIAVRQYAVFKQAAGKTAQSIMVSCSVRLTVFNMKSITKLTSVDNIDLTSIGKEKTALFCITPVVDTTFNFLVALLYTQLFETLYNYAETKTKGIRLPVHVRFLLDEFANIGTIPDFEQKLSTMRSYEISCTVIIQNLAQLKTMYKDSWESVTGNCDSFLFLGGQEQTTLEYVSKKLGKQTIRQMNTSRNVGGKGGGGSMSYNVTGRDLMTPDEISRMDTSDCILFIRGLLPFFGKKYDYPKHPNYQYTGDADDNLLYDVKSEFSTSATVSRRNNPYIEEKRRIKIMTEKAETRHAEKIERMQRERREKTMRRRSLKGQPLYEGKPAEEVIVNTLAEVAKEQGTNNLVVEDHITKVVESFAPPMEEVFGGFMDPDEIQAMYNSNTASVSSEDESASDQGGGEAFEQEYDYGFEDSFNFGDASEFM